MNKALRITLIVIASVLVLLGLFLLIWFFGDNYDEFYDKTNKEFAISGLNEGFTPQGLCYDDGQNLFLVCGYMKNGTASRVYVVDGATGETTKYFTIFSGQEKYTGHSGGITTDGTSVWIAGDGKVQRFAFGDVASVENGDSIAIIDSFESNNGADFVTFDPATNRLWVGEFQKDGKYDRPESHIITLSNGKVNKAVSFCYEVNNAQPHGIASTTPIMALSTPSLVQGMVITDDKIVTSTSYSLPNSHFYTYSNITTGTTDKTFMYDTTEIPLYVLEEGDILDDLEAPSMSEELALVNGKVFVLFENACQKYSFATREHLYNVYSFDLN